MRRIADVRLVTRLVASAVVIPSEGSAQSSPGHRVAPPAAVVDTVQIQRENVFDRSEDNWWLARVANSLHIVTRERVIERELLVREGEPYDSATAAETARNLRKLGIFRDVVVDSARTSAGLVARVATHDSWTTQLYTTFKAGGDQITWGVGVVEKNLLGSQIQASLRYTDDPDRSTTQAGVSLPRIWRNRVGIKASVDELSDGKRAAFNASAPFVTLSSRNSFSFELRYNDGDVLRFFEGESEASDTLRHLLTKGVTTYGWAPQASKTGYVRLGTTLQVRRENFSSGAVAEEDRSLFGEVEFSVEASRAQFSVVRGYRSLSGPEDIDLSHTVRMGVWVAPAAFGYERGGIGVALSAQAGKTYAKGFVRAALRATSLFTSAGLDSGGVTTGVVVALQPTTRQSVVLNADAGWLENPRPGGEYDLGLSFGPRGFPLHAFTGDRAFFTTAEYRWLAFPDVFGLAAIGLAAFADHGGAWYDGSPQRSGTDVGVGIRIGSVRSSSGKPATRVDLAHRFANDVLGNEWVVAVGAGFPFERR